MRFCLALPNGYRFDAMIDAHGWPQLVPFSWDAEARLLRLEKGLQVSGGAIVYRMDERRAGPTAESNAWG